MRKLLLSVSAILFGAVLLVSCSKELRTKKESGQANKPTTRMAGANYSFNERGECMNDGANCHASGPIIITKPTLEAIADAESGGKTVVGNVFNSDLLNPICAEISIDLEAMLKSGNYYIRKNFENAFVINYMIGQDYPVTAQNMTTAFQLNK